MPEIEMSSNDAVVLGRLAKCKWTNPETGEDQYGVLVVETGPGFKTSLAEALNIQYPEMIRELPGILLRLSDYALVKKSLLGPAVTHVRYSLVSSDDNLGHDPDLIPE